MSWLFMLAMMFCFKQKTAYEMRISDWSSDVCSSDLRISWDDALDRISRLLKDDRDANFIEKNDDGKTVNRWLTTGMLAASASSNEVAYITHKVFRSFGALAFDNQARV